MKVVITGASGFVGRHLTEYYLQQKATVITVSRQKRRSDQSLLRHMTWEELETNIKPLEGVDAIINLAGESINQRWTNAAKERILQSRLDAVERVRSLIERLDPKPVLVNASGVSIYGTSETDSFSEESELRTDDFLASVVDQWEAAAEQIPDTRVVLLRVGIVLGRDGAHSRR
ncbi:NAD-dependent epimerase/dehydratase family protein [Paenibacillus sp. P26]|nr:NAD-dependent epimerase/dehydratase family protein [Paenibacillus sp. P26]